MEKTKISNSRKLMITYLVFAILVTIWSVITLIYSIATNGNNIGQILSQILVLSLLLIPEIVLIAAFVVMNIVLLASINKLNTKSKALTLTYSISSIVLLIAAIVVFVIVKNMLATSIIQFVGVIIPMALCCVDVNHMKKSN